MKIKNIYVIYDKLSGDDVLCFTEYNDNRAIITGLRSIGQIIPYKETEMFKVGEYDVDEKKVMPVEKIIKIEYESFKPEDQAEDKTVDEIEKRSKEIGNIDETRN